MKDFLTAQEVTNLKAAHRIEKDRRRADRIKAILLLNDGLSYTDIAKILLLDETTIRRYEKEFKISGIDGLLEDHYHGSAGLLTQSQEEELVKYLRTNLHQTAREVAAYINRVYGASCSIEGATNLLHRLNFVYKKTKISSISLPNLRCGASQIPPDRLQCNTAPMTEWLVFKSSFV